MVLPFRSRISVSSWNWIRDGHNLITAGVRLGRRDNGVVVTVPTRLFIAGGRRAFVCAAVCHDQFRTGMIHAANTVYCNNLWSFVIRDQSRRTARRRRGLTWHAAAPTCSDGNKTTIKIVIIIIIILIRTRIDCRPSRLSPSRGQTVSSLPADGSLQVTIWSVRACVRHNVAQQSQYTVLSSRRRRRLKSVPNVNRFCSLVINCYLLPHRRHGTLETSGHHGHHFHVLCGSTAVGFVPDGLLDRLESQRYVGRGRWKQNADILRRVTLPMYLLCWLLI